VYEVLDLIGFCCTHFIWFQFLVMIEILKPRCLTVLWQGTSSTIINPLLIPIVFLYQRNYGERASTSSKLEP